MARFTPAMVAVLALLIVGFLMARTYGEIKVQEGRAEREARQAQREERRQQRRLDRATDELRSAERELRRRLRGIERDR